MADTNGDLCGVILAAGEALRRESAIQPVAPVIELRPEGAAVEEWFESFRVLCGALAAEARDESKRRFED